MSCGRWFKFTWACGHPLDPLVVRLFSPSNKRMVSAGRCFRREASGNNAKISGGLFASAGFTCCAVLKTH
jgi:hypothetical protein